MIFSCASGAPAGPEAARIMLADALDHPLAFKLLGRSVAASQHAVSARAEEVPIVMLQQTGEVV